MPVKTQLVTEATIRSIPTPAHGRRYTPIAHGTIIDNARIYLANAGFTINQELYKSSLDGQIAQGTYHLNYGTDPDMGLMFAWSNSYNKQMRFKCAIGAHVFICMNGVVSGDLGNYKRKHTGSALVDVINSIKDQISQAKVYYDNLVADKEMLKQINLSKAKQGEVIGRLFIEQEVLTLTQIGMVQREIQKPSHRYSQDPNSAWDLYNHVTMALKDSHPMSYLSDHQKVHNFFVNELGQLKGVYMAIDEDTFPDQEPEEEPVAYQQAPILEPVDEIEEELTGFGVKFN
jgi:hypothetical protein